MDNPEEQEEEDQDGVQPAQTKEVRSEIEEEDHKQSEIQERQKRQQGEEQITDFEYTLWTEIGVRQLLRPAVRINCLRWTPSNLLVACISDNIVTLRPEALIQGSNVAVDTESGPLSDRAVLDPDLGRRLELRQGVIGLDVVVAGKSGEIEVEWKEVCACGEWIAAVGGEFDRGVSGWRDRGGERLAGAIGGWKKEWTLGKGVDPLTCDCIQYGDKLFVAAGGKNGLGVWMVAEKGRGAEEVEATLVQIIDERWASRVKWIQDFYAEADVLFLSVGRLDTTVEVYKITISVGKSNKLNFACSLVWGDSRGLPVPVSILSWDVAPDWTMLTTGAGNALTCYLFDQGSEDIPFPSFIRTSVTSAHGQLVSAIVFDAKHDIITAGQDGAVALWRLTDDPPSLQHMMNIKECAVDYPAFGLSISPNRQLIAVATTCLELAGPITASQGEGSTMNKFKTSQRRCLTSIYSPQVVGDVDKLIMGIAQKHCDKDEKCLVSMWDLEEALKGRTNIVPGEIVEKLVLCAENLVDNEKAELVKVKVAYCLLKMALRIRLIQTEQSKEISFVDTFQKCRNTVLQKHAFRSLTNLAQQHKPPKKRLTAVQFSQTTLRVGKSLLSLIGDSNEVESYLEPSLSQSNSLKKIRQLVEAQATKKHVQSEVCPMCGLKDGSLTRTAEDLNDWYTCKEGEKWPTCVLTGLPVLDAVPLACQGCQVYARLDARDDPDLDWISRRTRCPFCNIPFSFYTDSFEEHGAI